MRKKFSFIFPLVEAQKDNHRRRGLRYDHLADLVVTGVAQLSDHKILDNISDRFGVEIESISYKGIDVSALLNMFGPLDTIIDACLNHVEHIFNGKSSGEDPIKLNPYTAKILSLPLKRKISYFI